jgi:hypothetical protein
MTGVVVFDLCQSQGLVCLWPHRTEGSARTIAGPFGTSGPAGAPLEQQRDGCPYRPVGREAFRSAASRKMDLWSPDRNLKTAVTDFKEATKGPAGPEHERSECEGGFGLRCRVP